jgi:hypothetical protein
MTEYAAVDIFRIIGQDLDGLLALSDIVSVMTSCKVFSDQPSESAEALQLFRRNEEWKTPFVRKMLADGMRPLNVYRARAVVEIHETFHSWIVGPEPGDAALAGTNFNCQKYHPDGAMAYKRFNSQIHPYDAQWHIVVLSMKVWVWRNAAVLTLTDMETHLNELIVAWPAWTVHGLPPNVIQ